ncbi:MAG: efflux RND transporter periplasmic adaptor subunit [Tatlockia sp.]|nr:efflux RND transporter periplasmic adaptor subunit [Tatlockia sp.]
MERIVSKFCWFFFGLIAFLPALADKPPMDIKGPHGGRLLKEGSIEVEVTIFEKEMPPHFRIFIFKNGRMITNNLAKIEINLKRFNGDINRIHFQNIDDFLQSKEIIKEPHSFDVALNLNLEGKTYHWNYSTYEGRIRIHPEIAKAANIVVAIAESKTLDQQIEVFGKIIPNLDTIIAIYPRYPGIIKQMHKKLGDNVVKGEPLLSIESSENLQVYPISAPIEGSIIKKNMNPGELAKGDKAIYEIADLTTVWLELTLYPKQIPLVKKGMQVTLASEENKLKERSQINYVSPLGIQESQTVVARAFITNRNEQWRPGMYVTASILLNQKKASVAIPLSALQKWRDLDIVFLQKGDEYEVMPVELGEKSDLWVEILSGLKPGDKYVVENSFFLKADLGKSGATHDDH